MKIHKGVFLIMFQQNLITNLLGIANVFVDKIENNSSNIEIHLSTKSKAQVCPCCKKFIDWELGEIIHE